MDAETLFLTVLPLLEEAGRKVLAVDRSTMRVQKKPGGGLVTDADLVADACLIAGIRNRFPEDTIISEESGVVYRGKKRTWHIDPLDGTNDFINGEEDFCIAIGLADTDPVFGALYFPKQKILLWGARGSGAYVYENRKMKRLQLSSSQTDLRILTDPKRSPDLPFPTGRRRMSLHARWILLGETGAFLNRKVQSWDWCAPAAILLAAGGFVGDYGGNALHVEQGRVPEILIGTPSCAAQALEELRCGLSGQV